MRSSGKCRPLPVQVYLQDWTLRVCWLLSFNAWVSQRLRKRSDFWIAFTLLKELSLIFAPIGRDYLAHLIRNPHSLIVKIFGLFRLNGPGPPLVLIVMQSVRSRFWWQTLPSAPRKGVFPGQPDQCEIRHQRLHGRKVQRTNDFFNRGFTIVITRTPGVPSRNYWVSARSKNQTKWPIEFWTLRQEI